MNEDRENADISQIKKVISLELIQPYKIVFSHKGPLHLTQNIEEEEEIHN